MAMVGAGESVTLAGSGVKSPSPRLLFSLGAALPVWLALLSLSPFSITPSLASPFGWSALGGLGARQVGSSQTTPVKLFNWNGLRSHRRHGVPLRSRARSPALMAPWLALGPSLCVVGASLVGSTVPSSLDQFSQLLVLTGSRGITYSLGFFLGPGLPLGLGPRSPFWVRPLLFPGLGPGIPFLRAPSAPAGVEGASEALSTDEAGGTASPEVDDGGDDMSFGLSLSSEGVLELGKRASRLDGSLRTMDRPERPLVEGEADEFEAGMSRGDVFSICISCSASSRLGRVACRSKVKFYPTRVAIVEAE